MSGRGRGGRSPGGRGGRGGGRGFGRGGGRDGGRGGGRYVSSRFSLSEILPMT